MDLVFLEDFFHRKLPLKAKILMTYFSIQSFTFCTKCISAAFEVTGCIVMSIFLIILNLYFYQGILSVLFYKSSLNPQVYLCNKTEKPDNSVFLKTRSKIWKGWTLILIFWTAVQHGWYLRFLNKPQLGWADDHD